jgi:heat shock 70kDa protein 1/2/6/8
MQTTIEIDSLCEGQDFNTTITRAKFEDLCMDLFRSTLEPIDKALRDAKVDKKSIDEIVLVGGSSRIPKVQEMLSAYFGGKELNKSINADEAISFGAAVQAAILSGEKDEKLSSVILVDVTPLSLGIETAGEVMTVLIPRNSKIPIEKSNVFSTFSDNQTQIEVKIYEGERTRTRDNNLLGSFYLSNIPPAPRGMPQIDIKFVVDANGIMSVSAVEKSTGVKNNITIKNEKGRLSNEDIKRKVEEAERMKDDDERFKQRAESKNSYENFVFGLKTSLTEETKSKLSSDDVKTLEACVKDEMTWMDSHRDATSEEYKDRQSNLQDKTRPIISKLYGSGTASTGGTAPPSSRSSHQSNGPTIEEID